MKKKLYILTPLICFLLYMILSSSSGGINGVSVSGCTCHGAVSSNTLVSIAGLPSTGYTNGTVYPITVSVTNNSITPSTLGLRDGFDLTSNGGSFTAIAGTSLNGATEIRHNTPKAPVSGTASWTFNWTAPSTGSTTIVFNLAGNATNGSGNTTGDQWNKTSISVVKATPPLVSSATNTSIPCNGGTCSITASGSGGTSPYTYQKNGSSFQASNLFTNNIAGNYTITVKDATNATASTVLSIGQPSQLVLSNPIITPVTCTANGAIQQVVTGGTGAKTYTINPLGPQTNNTGNFSNLTAQLYTIVATDANACTIITSINLAQPICQSLLDIKCYIQAYYVSGGSLKPVLQNQSVSGALATDCDDILVKLYNPNNTSQSIASLTTRLKTNGTAQCVFPPLNGNFYVSITHRNSIETWSANPIPISTSTTTTYDFTNAANKAYANNQIEVENGKWAFFSADINHDNVVDANDYSLWEADANNFISGFYDTDIDGDGAVGVDDYSYWEPNSNNFVGSAIP